MAKNFENQKTTTLVAWWRELNRWGWPKSLGVLQEHRRDEYMTTIERVLGRRVVLGKIK